ncbi:MAG TPA: amidohydrolase family protein, partial [Taishania sp.]|nr:amidohydrolase family protein [Taishania sp.]
MKFVVSLLLVFLICFISIAQDKPYNGVAPSVMSSYILKNATIIVSPQKTIQNGFIHVENGKIKDIGSILLKNIHAVEIDCKGKTIVPAFIELNSSVGMPPVQIGERSRTPQLESKKESYFSWNDAIRPEFSSASQFKSNPSDFAKLQQAGFGFALTHLQDGIVRGTGSLIALGSHPIDNVMLHPDFSAHFSLEKGSSKQAYPSSQMGSIALLRQNLYDAKWYKTNGKKDARNLSLDALVKQLEKPIFFSTREAVEILRGQKIANEFGLTFNFVGSGDEYQYLDELKRNAVSLVIPMWFPSAFQVDDPYVNMEIPLKELKHWELAPSNPYLLAKYNIPFCLSFDKNKSEKEFWTHIRKAMERGLSAQQALAGLTTNPAKVLGLQDEIGTLEEGKIASFSVYSDNPFEKDAELLEVWTLEYPKVLKEGSVDGVEGTYSVLVDNKTYSLDIIKSNNKFEGKITNAIKKEYELATININGSDIILKIKDSIAGVSGAHLLHGKMNTKVGVFEGEGTDITGKWIKWNAVKHKKLDSEKKSKPMKIDSSYQQKIWFPNMAYGRDTLPKSKSYVITNVTAWTNENEGIIKNATVVVENGKISYVGTGDRRPVNAIVINGRGMHLTNGIIDEHSHIAISKGVNEGGQSVTAEVSIGDVVRNNDINIYRQLAGGVTTSQLLHGSANAIGGQSAIIKLKWGAKPDDMLIPNAPKFIKFALGENVKQSNWGEDQTVRFPQTRMGVEQVYIDAFTRAKKYHEDKAKGEYRVDLELETLSEIINKERFITCHSYIQSEINMLMKVAEMFNFNV